MMKQHYSQQHSLLSLFSSTHFENLPRNSNITTIKISYSFLFFFFFFASFMAFSSPPMKNMTDASSRQEETTSNQDTVLNVQPQNVRPYNILVNLEKLPTKLIGEEVHGAKDLQSFAAGSYQDSTIQEMKNYVKDVDVNNQLEDKEKEEAIEETVEKFGETEIEADGSGDKNGKQKTLSSVVLFKPNYVKDNSSLVDQVLATFIAEGMLERRLRSRAKKSLLLGTDIKEDILESKNLEESSLNNEDDQPDEPDDLFCSWRQAIYGDGFVVPFAKVKGLTDRLLAFVVFPHPINLGGYPDDAAIGNGAGNYHSTHIAVVILTPLAETKAVYSEDELARTFGSMLRDEWAYARIVEANNEEEIRLVAGVYAEMEIQKELKAYAEGSKGYNSQFDDLQRTGKLFGGLVNDVKRKYKWSVYKSDWTDGWNEVKSVLKYISVTAWLYFAVIMPIIAFGTVNDKNTDKEIGISETVLSQAIAGLISSLTAGQPLAIVMTTGPVTVFIQVIYSWCEGLKIAFLPFYAWTGLWAALYMTIIVAFDLIAYVRYVTQFTEEIFAMLVACIFISQYIDPLVTSAKYDPTVIFLLSFLLATGMFITARYLSLFQRSYLLNNITRTLLADFGMPASVLFWSGMRQIFTNVNVLMLQVPEEPGFNTTNGRSWLVDLGGISVGYIFLAMVPALFLTMLFYVDQNAAVLLTNKHENKLKKGFGYFLDMQVIAIIMVIHSIIGVPWTNAAIPHSHLHAKILAEKEEYEMHGRNFQRILRAREVRITNFVTHVLILVTMFALKVVGYIPQSVVWGFFLYIGVATFDGNQFFERVVLVFTQPEKYPPNHYVRKVSPKKMFLYTLIQGVCLVILWFVNANFYLPEGGVFTAGLLFPLVIISFVPIRMFLLPKIFTIKELHALESENEDITSLQ